MKELSPEFLQAGTRNAQLNTWGNRYHHTVPAVKNNGASIIYSTALVSVQVTPVDEIVLYNIMKFLFMPVWLVHEFYGSDRIAGMRDQIDDMLDKWVMLGIVWKESAVTGQYLRPTYALFQMFQQPPYRYVPIPFNTLTHTICEEWCSMKIMSGDSPICKNEVVMPRVSELGFEGKLGGTNVLSEEDFRNPNLMQEYQKVLDLEHRVNEGMKQGKAVTPELADFRYMMLVKKVNNTGEVKKDLKFHVPDLVVPVVRKQGKPMSIAVEIELSNKRTNYQETMERYKDNNKFGVVYWFCANESIASYLRKAHQEVGGTGSCRMKIMEWVTPSPKW